jgi:hypothetical protein
VAYVIIVYLYMPYFQLFPENREPLIYLPACDTSTKGIVGYLLQLLLELSI